MYIIYIYIEREALIDIKHQIKLNPGMPKSGRGKYCQPWGLGASSEKPRGLSIWERNIFNWLPQVYNDNTWRVAWVS